MTSAPRTNPVPGAGPAGAGAHHTVPLEGIVTAPPPLRLGSLCTGYAGLDEAVTAALAQRGIPTVTEWVADPDPGASAILAHRMPGVPNLGDITAVDWADVPPVDVLAGGFPCQDVSAAGARAGIAPGTRSGLWATFAHAIHSLRPQIVVIENVRGLLSASADRGVGPDGTPLATSIPGPLRAVGAVLGDLASLGLDAEWVSVRASDVGAPHRRERVFLLAWPAAEDADGSACGERRQPAPGQAAGWGPRPDARGRGGAPAADADGGRRGPGVRDLLQGESDARRGGAGTAPAADADRDALRQQPVGQPGGGRAAVARLAGADAASDADDRAVRTVPDGGTASTEADHEHHRVDLAGRVLADRWGAYAPAVHRWERVTGRPAPAPTEPGRTGQPRLSPAFVEWLMGLPAGWVTDVPGLSRTQRLHALGNGVVPQQGAAALGLLLDRAGLDLAPARALEVAS
ncbi:DNA cytosine methyltransferase [Streptomyces lonarensis]|uniref:DNA (cytosine-5-)-methyltransferase n=2 Tax=Streptomyces lonarensis TaxID=700599 RepID=A0A7X6CXJ9_9ACTN|nr:DNA cytosine methyltransferase [Streptomyces lonarensis]